MAVRFFLSGFFCSRGLFRCGHEHDRMIDVLRTGRFQSPLPNHFLPEVAVIKAQCSERIVGVASPFVARSRRQRTVEAAEILID